MLELLLIFFWPVIFILSGAAHLVPQTSMWFPASERGASVAFLCFGLAGYWLSVSLFFTTMWPSSWHHIWYWKSLAITFNQYTAAAAMFAVSCLLLRGLMVFKFFAQWAREKRQF
jgi:hypothetical protein